MNLIKELKKDENEFWKQLFETIEIKKSAYSFYEEDAIEKAFEAILQYEDREELEYIIKDISQGEKIEKIAFGSSSVVFKTGKNQEIIFKIGFNRQKYKIPYHPRIMQPLFRKKYTNNLYLEIFYMGEYENADITGEEVLEIFKELEKAGIFWGDARPENIVRLKKKNDIPDYIGGKYINLFGYDDENLTRDQFVALQVGDYVICDLDFLFKMDDPQKSMGNVCPEVYDYMKKNQYNISELELNFIYNAMKKERERDEFLQEY